MPIYSTRLSIVAKLAVATVCFTVSILAWLWLSETRENGSLAVSAKRNGRTQLHTNPAALSHADTDTSLRIATVKADHNCELRYSLLSLPSETAGGVALRISIDEDTTHFPETTAIRSVTGHGFCADTWKSIGTLSQLESLTHYGDATNEDLECLKSFPLLEVLRLISDTHRSEPTTWPGRHPPYSAVALSPIKGMKRLRELSLASDSLNDEGLEIVSAVPGLLSLKLDGFFTNETLRHVGELRELRRLSLTGNFDDEGVRLLTRLVNLEALELNSGRLRGAGLANLASLPNLRYLRIAHATPDLSLSELASCPALAVLDLGSAGITDDILSTLPSLPHLQSLSVDENLINDEGLNALTRLANLTELNLRRTLITDAGIETITKHEPFQQHLRVLCLGERNVYNAPPTITQAGLTHLSRLSQLEALDLRYVNLVEVDLQVLALPSLRRLNAEGLMQDPQNEKLQRLFRRLPHLSRDIDGRIVIRADLCRESEMIQYDFLSNRLTIEL